MCNKMSPASLASVPVMCPEEHLALASAPVADMPFCLPVSSERFCGRLAGEMEATQQLALAALEKGAPLTEREIFLQHATGVTEGMDAWTRGDGSDEWHMGWSKAFTWACIQAEHRAKAVASRMQRQQEAREQEEVLPSTLEEVAGGWECVTLDEAPFLRGLEVGVQAAATQRRLTFSPAFPCVPAPHANHQEGILDAWTLGHLFGASCVLANPTLLVPHIRAHWKQELFAQYPRLAYEAAYLLATLTRPQTWELRMR